MDIQILEKTIKFIDKWNENLNIDNYKVRIIPELEFQDAIIFELKLIFNHSGEMTSLYFFYRDNKYYYIDYNSTEKKMVELTNETYNKLLINRLCEILNKETF